MNITPCMLFYLQDNEYFDDGINPNYDDPVMINSPLDDYAFERPRMYERPRPPIPLEPVSTSPLPNEIVSAVSLLKDYMKEGDAAIEKHKSKVCRMLYFLCSFFHLNKSCLK